jgi:hypothetical protein
MLTNKVIKTLSNSEKNMVFFADSGGSSNKEELAL